MKYLSFQDKNSLKIISSRRILGLVMITGYRRLLDISINSRLLIPQCMTIFFTVHCLEYARVRVYSNSYLPVILIAWNVSVFGVILVPIFRHSDWIRRDTEYLSGSVRLWENADQNNFDYGHFLRSVCPHTGIYGSDKTFAIFCAMVYFSQADNIPYTLLILVTKDSKISKTATVYFT